MKPCTQVFRAAILSWLVLSTSLSAAEQSKVVKLGHLPKSIQSAIRKHAGEGKLGEIDKITEDGEVSYDVEVTQGAKTRSFSVGASGELLSTQVFLDETPVAVQKAIRKESSKGTLGEIDKVVEDGDTSYEVEIVLAGKTRNFTFSDDGESVSLELSLEETPAAVRKAIASQSADGKLGGISRTIEDGETNYEVEITKAGKTHNFTFSDDAQSIRMEISLEEAPAAVKKAIESQTKDGKLNLLEKVTEDGEVFYDIEFIKGQKTRNLSFDENGAITSEEVSIELRDAPPAVQQAVKSLLAGGEILDITQTTESTTNVYSVSVRTGGSEKNVNLDAAGKILPEVD